MIRLSFCLWSMHLLVLACLLLGPVESFRTTRTKTWLYPPLRSTMTDDGSSTTTRLLREESTGNIMARRKNDDNPVRFARTNRVDGLRRWVREICMLRNETISPTADSATRSSGLIGISLIIEHKQNQNVDRCSCFFQIHQIGARKKSNHGMWKETV